MKLPNGYGSVYKLSGHRRKPWAARKTTGWKIDETTKKTQPVYKFIGYFETKTEAMQALSLYNAEPIHYENVTLGELYAKWSELNFPRMPKSVKSLRAAWNVLKPIEDTNLKDITLDILQDAMDNSGKRRPTLKSTKTLLGHLFDYAVLNKMCDASKRAIVGYLDLSKAANDKVIQRIPFSDREIEKLWNAGGGTAPIVLILIYTGLRVNELFDLKCEDVHLEDRYLYIRSSKTEAGVRQVPIAEKIVPFIEQLLFYDNIFLVSSITGKHFVYETFRAVYWDPLMQQIGADHRPHDTRHTCVTLLTNAGIDARLIKLIVGHKGGGDVTTDIYTHFTLKQQLEAINKI